MKPKPTWVKKTKRENNQLGYDDGENETVKLSESNFPPALFEYIYATTKVGLLRILF